MRLNIINSYEGRVIDLSPLYRPVTDTDARYVPPDWRTMNVVYLRRKKGKRLNGKFIKPVFRSMGCTFGDEPVYQKATHNTATHAQERRTVENQYPYAKFSDGMFFRVEGDNIKMDKVYENRKPLKIVTDGWNEVLLRRYGYSAT